MIQKKWLLLIFIGLIAINSILGFFVIQSYFFSDTTSISISQRSTPVIDQLRIKASNSMGKDEYQAFLSSVSRVAVDTTTLEVKGCTLSPRVMKVRNNSTLSIINTGNSTVFLTLPLRKSIRIEENQSTSYQISVTQKIPSAFGIGCGGERVASGILYVIE